VAACGVVAANVIGSDCNCAQSNTARQCHTDTSPVLAVEPAARHRVLSPTATSCLVAAAAVRIHQAVQPLIDLCAHIIA
jgi:hypothetical protein